MRSAMRSRGQKGSANRPIPPPALDPIEDDEDATAMPPPPSTTRAGEVPPAVEHPDGWSAPERQQKGNANLVMLWLIVPFLLVLAYGFLSR